MTHRVTISGWGNYPRVEVEELAPLRWEDCPSHDSLPYLPRGLGRSYGDASLPGSQRISLNTRYLKNFIDFDESSGVLEAESGVSLEEILKYFVPRGWFLPVTPGTKFVTLGGAVGSNVHGKNHHHVGSFENFIESMRVRTPSGVFDCSAEEREDLFRGTVSGYGLTGLIERVRLKMIPIETAYIRARNIAADHLEALFELFAEYDHVYHYSVAWIDTLARGSKLGRSVLILGDHANMSDLESFGWSAAQRAKARTLPFKPKINVPIYGPNFLLNPLLLRLFNLGIYQLKGHTDREYITDYDAFFYPLDSLHNWNRMYGRRGFLQYQLVIPDPHGYEGISASLHFLSNHGIGSFLSILKRCGDDHPIIPFAKQGYSLALDIPFRNDTLALLEELDKLVLEYGGRVYLSKDARLSPATFREMYPTEHLEWREVIATYNPDRTVWSAMAERLEL